MGEGGVKPNAYDCVQGQRGGGGGVKVLYVHTKKIFLDCKISKLFFFCAKEVITLSFVIVYRQV